MTITPIEESFALLNRYQLHYSSTDSEQVDGLTYAWKKLQAQVFFNFVLYPPFHDCKKVIRLTLTQQTYTCWKSMIEVPEKEKKLIYI